MAAPLEDCCGLGCNNCILDRFLDVKRPGDTAGTINLFNKKEYQKFIVKEIKKVLPLVYQFTFELLCERDVPFRIEEQLFAPPVSYLMLRAFRNFEDSNPEFNELFMDFKEFMHPPKSEDTTKYFRMEPQRFDKGTPEIYFSRKYTPYEVNEQYRTFKILVKLETFGKMSRYFTTLKVGSICEFKGPFEAYKYKKEERENYLVFTQDFFI
ncbi:CLUMA_CG008010, isoform A [Clunio marinus]|uniref:CLUMA_CG008010, isoform A n=1 Tax=Clunio marinus TaxID=568069 RepID=A0A1J1I7X7_9DIPT|nr:CLUMA_CG008010, isoform A [Clunio marinus]